MMEEDYDIIPTFDVADLRPFLGLKGLKLRTTPFKKGDDDDDILAN